MWKPEMCQNTITTIQLIQLVSPVQQYKERSNKSMMHAISWNSCFKTPTNSSGIQYTLLSLIQRKSVFLFLWYQKSQFNGHMQFSLSISAQIIQWLNCGGDNLQERERERKKGRGDKKKMCLVLVCFYAKHFISLN